ncbi:MAG: hypothetical protein HZC25_05270 [Rhodospirillales bacterium]|nr:hypothetical protein [Rhodospirillales bacterium]
MSGGWKAGLSAAVLLVFLAGCTRYQLAEPRLYNFENHYLFKTRTAWNTTSEYRAVMWTKSGEILDALYFFEPTPNGQSPFAPESQEKFPPFRTNMTVLDLRDFLTTSLSNIKALDIEYQSAKPIKLGQTDAHRFDFTYRRKSRLEMRGIALLAIHDHHLYFVLFMAESSHYYGALIGEVEEILASLRVPAKAKS